MTMPDHVYRIIQVAGSSEKSIEDAIQNAVGRASRTLRQVGWFEVVETRGHVEDGAVAHYQVTLKCGVYARRRRLTSGHFREGFSAPPAHPSRCQYQKSTALT